MRLSDKVKGLPKRPGVYLFKDAKGRVIYVGKAKDLRKRVSSYFQKGRDERPHVEFLVKRTKNVDFVVTDTEKEALLLENTLIKRHKPRYNFMLKDDKNYLSIKVTLQQQSPGIYLTRHIRKDGARYFGPYDSSTAGRTAVEQITRFFKLRTCSDTEFANRVRPCLKFDIGRCTAPCVGKVSKDEYAAQVEEATMFLAGVSSELIRRLKLRMDAASEKMEYEGAAAYRDAIDLLKDMREKQKAVVHGGGDHDAIGLFAEEGRACICAIMVRGGTIVDRRTFFSDALVGDEQKLVSNFLLQRYVEAGSIPPRIFLPGAVADKADVEMILGERRNGKVAVAVPKIGAMRRLVELAGTNAKEAISSRRRKRADERVFERLAKKLGVRGEMERVECVDISNLHGKEAVGSIVSFLRGEPDKANYRIYNIRTLDMPDDYAMMREVIVRRLSSESRALPDLLLVDGGKGQLAVAMSAMKELGADLPVAAIAKMKKGERSDKVFIPLRKNPLNLKRGSKELLFLMRIRDEAHRFGINAHRRLRGKRALNG